MQKIQNLTYITFFWIFSEKQWNMVFMYLHVSGISRWFQIWLQISCGTNGSLSRPKLVLNIGNFKEFRNICSKNGLSREPFVPHEIWSHIWNQRQILKRHRYMKTIFHCFSEEIPQKLIYVRFIKIAPKFYEISPLKIIKLRG